MSSRWRLTTEIPSGLRYVPDLVTEADERALQAKLDGLAFRPVVMRGVTAKRTTVHFGWDYGYESWKITPAPAMPDWLAPLRERAAALVPVSPESLVEVLITRYPSGASIGWHRDASMFGPTVVGVSLAAPSVLRLRRRAGDVHVHFRLPLAARSAYVLGGAARASWQHALGPTRGLRYSITFRTLRKR